MGTIASNPTTLLGLQSTTTTTYEMYKIALWKVKNKFPQIIRPCQSEYIAVFMHQVLCVQQFTDIISFNFHNRLMMQLPTLRLRNEHINSYNSYNNSYKVRKLGFGSSLSNTRTSSLMHYDNLPWLDYKTLVNRAKH